MVAIQKIFSNLLNHYNGKPIKVEFAYNPATSQLMVNGKEIMSDLNQKFINESYEQYVSLDGKASEFETYLTDFIISEIDVAIGDSAETNELYTNPAVDDFLTQGIEDIRKRMKENQPTASIIIPN